MPRGVGKREGREAGAGAHLHANKKNSHIYISTDAYSVYNIYICISEGN